MRNLLAVLVDATRAHQPIIDEGRMRLIDPRVTPATYLTFLVRVYGFEAPVEAAFLRTPHIDDLIDLRARSRMRLLRADLAMLGETSAEELPAMPAPAFARVGEALGWMYVIERNALLHGLVRRHLETAIPTVIHRAGSYLAANDRVTGLRWKELGEILDRYARTILQRDQVVDAAFLAIRALHAWFSERAPIHRRAA